MTVESSLHFLSHLNIIVSMTTTACWVCSEASSANDNNFCSEASYHGNSDSIVVMYCVRVPVLSEQNMSKPQRVVRAVDTTDGQLFIDLISKVEGEDGLRASIHQTFHWSTNSIHKMEQGSGTSSHAADSVKFFERVRNPKSRHVSHFGESVICD